MDTAQTITVKSSIEIMTKGSSMTYGMPLITITRRYESRRAIYHHQDNAASGTPEHHLGISHRREAAGNSGITYPRVLGLCVGKDQRR